MVKREQIKASLAVLVEKLKEQQHDYLEQDVRDNLFWVIEFPLVRRIAPLMKGISDD